jgi:Cof subfamily protein (haloacid dehalogenase superfamily)
VLAPRLIAVDIDGTIVDHSDVLPERVAAALRAATAAGIEVILATGRPYVVAGQHAEVCGATHVVASNGSSIHRVPGGDVLDEVLLERSEFEAAVTIIRAAIPGAGFMVVTTESFGWEPGFPDIVPVDPPIEHATDDVLTVPGERVRTLGVFQPALPTDDLLARLAEVLPPDVSAGHMGVEMAEVNRFGIDKAHGVARLCERLGIAAHEVLAFGDNSNDRTMLQWAGWGVAVANADPETRACADEIAPAQADDGVAVVVERVLAQVGGS